MSTLLLLALGCSGSSTDDAVVDADADADSDADSDADTDADTDTWGHSGDPHSADSASGAPTADTAPPFEVDCNALSNRPLSMRQLTGARGYHDVIMTQDPFILGQDTQGTLIRAPYMQNGAPLVPGIGTIQQFDWLPNGDLAVMRDINATVTRVNPLTGGMTVITQLDSNGYGIRTAPDGKLWVADYSAGLVRVDPATGAKETLLRINGLNPRVINWSPDYSRLYIGTFMGDGRVFYIDLDQNMDPIDADSNGVADVRVFATGVGSGSYHDALEVDYCGNLYMTDYSYHNMYRIDPQGNVSLYLDMNVNNQYGHGARFGNGVGGFRLDALYVPQPYNGHTVAEIVIGVPSRSWDGTPF